MNPRLSATANAGLDAVRPQFDQWFAAVSTTPFAKDLWDKDPAVAVKHIAWQAVVTFGPHFQTLAGARPTAGSIPGPGAPSAAVGVSPCSGGRARASVSANAERGTVNAEGVV